MNEAAVGLERQGVTALAQNDTEKIARYLDPSSESNSRLNQLGRETLVARFNHLVEVHESVSGAHTRIITLNSEALARFFHINRLPNALLFGADTLGPDLCRDFASLIENQESAAAYREETERKAKSQGRSRSCNYYDIEALERRGLSADELIYAGGKRWISIIFDSHYPAGTCISFFYPEYMPHISGLSGDAYIAPPPEGTKQILVFWNARLNLVHT